MQATTGQVVTFGGQPVTMYFFSTSGGETEDVENSFVGSQPKPWLKAVDDPFDSVSPKHRWGPYRFTTAQVQRKLHRYLQGRFKRIKVLKRGVSPRVVRAQVVGTGGVTNVTGPQLRSAFGLFDTWAFFTSVTTKASKPKPKAPAATPATPATTGGVSPVARAAAAHASRLEGTIAPARVGRWVRVERREGTRWGRGDRLARAARRALLRGGAGAGGLPRGLRAGRGAIRAGLVGRGLVRVALAAQTASSREGSRLRPGRGSSSSSACVAQWRSSRHERGACRPYRHKLPFRPGRAVAPFSLDALAANRRPCPAGDYEPPV